MAMTALEALKRIRKLLADPKSWKQGTYAKDAKGNTVQPTDPKATCWCLVGAARKVLADTPVSARPALGPVLLGMGSTMHDLVSFNDYRQRTHAEVVALLDETITRLGRKKRA
jgi:hypothetical protein